jgi:hypothetical protein
LSGLKPFPQTLPENGFPTEIRLKGEIESEGGDFSFGSFLFVVGKERNN